MGVAYDLEKDGELKHFNSAREACNFLGVTDSVVANAFKRGTKCQGWNVYKLGERDGRRKERLYDVWVNMKKRCYSQYSINYDNYGGRGIKICDEWMTYDNFRLWALNAGYDEDAPRGVCTIERIDVNGDYCPDNCTWKTAKEQNNNTRRNRFIKYDGEEHTLAEWSNITGISYNALKYRLDSGWDIDQLFTIPCGGKSIYKDRLITCNGETHNIKEWADILNIKYSTLYSRISMHKPMKNGYEEYFEKVGAKKYEN